MDWTGCELVEVIEGKVSGVPLVAGTRIPADVIAENHLLGQSVEEILEDYPRLSRDIVERLIAFQMDRLAASAA